MTADIRSSDQPVEVECYSGHTYAQAPVAFTKLSQRHVVLEIERSWRVPAGPVFRLLTVAGLRWELAYNEARDTWSAILLT